MIEGKRQVERWEEGTGGGGRARSRHLERKERGAEMERIKPKADAKDGGRRVKKEEERVGRLRRGGKRLGRVSGKRRRTGKREHSAESFEQVCESRSGAGREQREKDTRNQTFALQVSKKPNSSTLTSEPRYVTVQ